MQRYAHLMLPLGLLLLLIVATRSIGFPLLCLVGGFYLGVLSTPGIVPPGSSFGSMLFVPIKVAFQAVSELFGKRGKS